MNVIATTLTTTITLTATDRIKTLIETTCDRIHAGQEAENRRLGFHTTRSCGWFGLMTNRTYSMPLPLVSRATELACEFGRQSMTPTTTKTNHPRHRHGQEQR